MKIFLRIIFIVILLPNTIVMLAQTKPGVAGRPNIVFILTDDQRFDAAHSLGTPELKTPNMDKLVAQGTTFTHTYIMGSDEPAVCAPSRAMLMTGQAFYRLPKGFRSSQPNIPPDTNMAAYTTFPEHFRNNGYYTYATGKWHNSRAAFAKSFSGGENLFFGGMHFENAGGHESPNLHHFDPSGKYTKDNSFKGKGFSSKMYADAAAGFLQNYKEEQPFLLYVAFTSPHDPRTPYKPFTDWYEAEKTKLPPNFLPKHPFDNGELTVRDETLLPFPRTREAVQQEIAKYYAMVSEVDAQMGRIMEALEKSGKAQNTIIVWAGDNGLALGQHGLLGKQNVYDHSVRVPLVFSGPGIPKNTKTDALCYLLDAFPTLCDLAGLPVPDGMDAKSLQPVISKKQKSHRPQLWFTYKGQQQGIRNADGWKLIRYQVNGETITQLFNLKEDPWEQQDVSKEPKYKTIYDHLVVQLDKSVQPFQLAQAGK